MKKVYVLSEVDPEACTGDRHCLRVCPTGAIEMRDRKAWVNPSRCAGCLHCLDACDHSAIRVLQRPEPLLLGVDPAGADPEEIAALCRRAHLDPQERICLCMDIRAGEVAAAVLRGASSPEEVSAVTGVRTSCAMWCMAVVQRLLRARGPLDRSPKGPRWYPVTAGIWNVPEEIVEKYPEYRLAEDRKKFHRGALENLVSTFKAR